MILLNPPPPPLHTHKLLFPFPHPQNPASYARYMDGPGQLRQCCCPERIARNNAELDPEALVCLPTFSIIGAQKSGSTALFGYKRDLGLVKRPLCRSRCLVPCWARDRTTLQCSPQAVLDTQAQF